METKKPNPEGERIHVRENRVGGYIIRTVPKAEADALIAKGGHEIVTADQFHEAAFSGIVVQDV